MIWETLDAANRLWIEGVKRVEVLTREVDSSLNRSRLKSTLSGK